jgi:hypothetical protein
MDENQHHFATKLPPLPPEEFERLRVGRAAIALGARSLLAARNDIGCLELLGMDGDEALEQYAHFVRDLTRLHATAYLDVAPAERVEAPLITRLISRIREEWIRGTTAERERLITIAKAEIRAEFEKCSSARRESLRSVHRPTKDETPERRERQPKPVSSASDFLDAEGAAEFLGVPLQWVRDHTTRVQPIVPHVRFGRKVRYERAELMRFAVEHREQRPRWERRPPSKGGRG